MPAAFHTSPSSRTFSKGSLQYPQWKSQCLPNPLNRPQSGPCYRIPRARPTTSLLNHQLLSAIPSSELDGGVFSTEDIVVGMILGVLLASMTSFLQGRRSQNDFVLWNNEEPEDGKPSSSSSSSTTTTSSVSSTDELLELEFAASNSTTLPETLIDDDMSIQQQESSSRSTVFDGDDWKEMSRPENYVFYNRNLKEKKQKKKKIESPEGSAEQTDQQKWVVVALLALFVPIFSVEFFFALSRQVLCGGGDDGLLSSLDAAQYLCSPVR
mmetsp:Transcript_8929/g.21252  ORF Transcript_8929/g.21252 Transcript_8929/m.21252 type:complete len:268 (-) Transcript_8929:209-1012(-)